MLNICSVSSNKIGMNANKSYFSGYAHLLKIMKMWFFRNLQTLQPQSTPVTSQPSHSIDQLRNRIVPIIRRCVVVDFLEDLY